MSGEEEIPEVIDEVISARQALIVVLVVLGFVLWYSFRWWRNYSLKRIEESFLDYDFALPAEKAQMEQLVQQRPDEKDMPALRDWHQQLVRLLVKRVMEVIQMHETVMSDYNTQMSLYKRGISSPLLKQVEMAKEIIQREVQECGMIANSLKPGWGQTIFPEAYKMKTQVDNLKNAASAVKKVKAMLQPQESVSEQEELAEIERLELLERERVREIAEKELLEESKGKK